MTKKKILTIILLLLLIIIIGSVWYILYGGSSNSGSTTPVSYSPNKYTSSSKDLLSYVQNDSSLSDFSQLASSGGLSDQLQGGSTSTGTLLIVPNNTAFKNSLTSSYSNSLLSGQNQSAAQDIAKYHLANLSTDPKNITDGQKITSVEGEEFIANLSGSKLTFTDAKGDAATVTQGPIVTSNGIIYIVDHVLLPQ